MKKFHKVFLPDENFINSCDNITFDNINYINMKPSAPHFHNTKELLIVSAFLDINREKWSTNKRYKKTAREYILSFSNYFNYSTKMLVFIDDKYIEELKEIYNNSLHNNTIFIPINNDWMTKLIKKGYNIAPNQIKKMSTLGYFVPSNMFFDNVKKVTMGMIEKYIKSKDGPTHIMTNPNDFINCTFFFHI